MEETRLREVVADIREGRLSEAEALDEMRRLPYADLDFAKIDHHRSIRQALPEAVYAPGKSVEHCVAIVGEMLEHSSIPVIVTRASDRQIEALEATHPGSQRTDSTLVWRPAERRTGSITVVTAGTADLPVANECFAVLNAYGFETTLLADCGVAGVHRLLDSMAVFDDADVVVVVAGMEGALASLVGGLVAAPVVAVPTSVGYGASFEGVTALLAMMASCAAGISVVGIDNGFGAACAATRIINGKHGA